TPVARTSSNTRPRNASGTCSPPPIVRKYGCVCARSAVVRACEKCPLSFSAALPRDPKHMTASLDLPHTAFTPIRSAGVATTSFIVTNGNFRLHVQGNYKPLILPHIFKRTPFPHACNSLHFPSMYLRLPDNPQAPHIGRLSRHRP